MDGVAPIAGGNIEVLLMVNELGGSEGIEENIQSDKNENPIANQNGNGNEINENDGNVNTNENVGNEGNHGQRILDEGNALELNKKSSNETISNETTVKKNVNKKKNEKPKKNRKGNKGKAGEESKIENKEPTNDQLENANDQNGNANAVEGKSSKPKMLSVKGKEEREKIKIEDLERSKRLRSESPPRRRKRISVRTPAANFQRVFLDFSVRNEIGCFHSSLPDFPKNAEPISFDELKLYPKCSFGPAKCVYISPRTCLDWDPLMKRTLNKEMIISHLWNPAYHYRTSLARSKSIRMKEKEHIYAKKLFDITERLHIDDKSFFNGRYDYYYTGGNLCVLPNSGDIVYVDGDTLGNLNIGRFNCIDEKGPSILEKCVTRKLRNEIFEVAPLYLGNDEDSFAVRQYHCLKLCSWQPTEQQFSNICQFKDTDYPVVSFCHSQDLPDRFVYTNIYQVIFLYNMSNGLIDHMAEFQCKFRHLATRWNCVRHWQDENFLYANDRYLNIMDVRAPVDQWLTTTFRQSHRSFDCDHLSALAKSKMDNLVYVGTAHKLHCVDLRKLGYSFESTGAVCSWTHFLQYPPQMIKTIKMKSTEYVALASALPGDLKICELYRYKNPNRTEENTQKYLHKSSSLPYEPPTLLETYERARLEAKCIDPNSDVFRRINYLNMGMDFYKKPDDEDYLFLFANSMGDVYAQNFGKRDLFNMQEQRVSKKSIKNMSRYSKQLAKQIPRELSYSSIAEFQVMRKIMNCEALSQKDVKEELEEAEKYEMLKKSQRLGRWHKSLQALHNYKDALVPSLLSIWDIDYEPEDDIRIKKENSFTKPDPATKVNEWLAKTYDPAPMISIPMLSSTSLRDSTIDDQTLAQDSLIKVAAPKNPNPNSNSKRLRSPPASSPPPLQNNSSPPFEEGRIVEDFNSNPSKRPRFTRSQMNETTTSIRSLNTSKSPTTFSMSLRNRSRKEPPIEVPAKIDEPLIDFSQTSICYDSFADLPHSTQIITNVSINETSVDLFPPAANDSSFWDVSGQPQSQQQLSTSCNSPATPMPSTSASKPSAKRKTKFVKGF